MEEEIKSLKIACQELNKFMNDFRRYCHTKRCLLTDECPEKHFWCKRKLNLDTSIAWRSKDVAERVLTECEYFLNVFNKQYEYNFMESTKKYNFPVPPESVFRTMDSSINKLQAHFDVLKLHRKKYKKLFEQIKNMLVLFVEINGMFRLIVMKLNTKGIEK